MAVVKALSMNPLGFWTNAEADKILAVINPEAEQQGLRYGKMVATTDGRVTLDAYCLYHEWPVHPDDACEMCLEGVVGTAFQVGYIPKRFR